MAEGHMPSKLDRDNSDGEETKPKEDDQAASTTAKKHYKIATVNTRSCSILPKTPNQNQFVMLLNDMKSNVVELLGIGQTHWMGEGVFHLTVEDEKTAVNDGDEDSNVDHVRSGNGKEVKESYLVAHCGVSDTAYRGVAIVLSGGLQQFVNSFDFVSYRIIGVDLKLEEDFCTVVQVFAPREGNVQLEHDTFWNQLKCFLANKLNKKSRFIVVMGDFDFEPTSAKKQQETSLEQETSLKQKTSLEQKTENAKDIVLKKFKDPNYEYCVSQSEAWSGSNNLVLTLKQKLVPVCGTLHDKEAFTYHNRAVKIQLDFVNGGLAEGNYPVPVTKHKITEKWVYNQKKNEKEIERTIDWSKAADIKNQPAATHVSIVGATPIVKKLTNSVEIISHMQALCEKCFGDSDFSVEVPEDKQDSAEEPLRINICVDAFNCANPETIGVESIELNGQFYCAKNNKFAEKSEHVGNLFPTISDFYQAALASDQLSSKSRASNNNLLGRNADRISEVKRS